MANITDLGCGRGRYTSVLSEAFEASVVGVDPSRKMLEQAQSKHQDSKISFKIASGEAIPAADGTVDMVFMSMVLHHLSSLKNTALECGRALRCDGSVCVRNTVADKIALRADSFVAQLEERGFEAGLSKLRAKAAGSNLAEKVGLNVDLFIFRKR